MSEDSPFPGIAYALPHPRGLLYENKKTSNEPGLLYLSISSVEIWSYNQSR